ncbi:hypothetical protein M2165_003276 [Variovorax sp. TBS-050B]|uniref:hypothetical protein n=1 Tax=Variovorax sp. TBS-050B TaxID=2940551 RepID=UPI0024772681|nr:hypothetical protein [Variovorax sp. TBS-050B]MDH6593387.1 hypothetical protein [Variovorax sp. TBS-050B]
MRKNLLFFVLGGAMAAAVIGGWFRLNATLGGTAGQQVQLLDPARIELIRTPGGHLQVSEMAKVEEFGWQTSWDCPLVDCSRLPKTVSRVRVQARYVYRIPLAAEWRLRPEGDHYVLTLPPLQLQAPVGFDTANMEIVTTEQSVLSPAAPANREKALRHLGPELARRGASPAYLAAQRQNAEQTVREFAQQWMREQNGRPIARPIRVEWRGPDPM